MENQQPVKEMITKPEKTGQLSYSFQLMISLFILFLVLAAGVYFRFTGMNWDENQHLHPDERFLTMVESSLEPVKSINDYFNTETSTLNPNNRGFGFYVYGTLPIFIVRYLAEYLDKSGYDQVFMVGRYASGFVDLLTVFLVFLIVDRLYRSPFMAVLAAAFSAFTVLQIQQSHYFTVDTFTNFFTYLAIYFAVCIATDIPRLEQKPLDEETVVVSHDDERDIKTKIQESLHGLLENWGSVFNYVLFGLALGMALSSKISVYQIAALLPLAAMIRLFQLNPEDRQKQFFVMARNIIIAAVISIIVFRICQPFAFKGPGFFDVGLNPKWVATLSELKGQTDGNVDFPPALQWARRPPWFAFQNMVIWGFGLPLGILSWSGFFWMAWKIFKGEWKKHSLIWGWTAVFFAMQSEVFNPTMRYLIFVYPSLSIIAAWAIFALWNDRKKEIDRTMTRVRWARVRRVFAVVVGLGVLMATAAWAFAFTRIYTRPITRVEASRWIYQNVPGPINPQIETDKGVVNLPVAFRSGATLMADRPLVIAFIPQQTALLMDVAILYVTDPFANSDFKTLIASISQDPDGQNIIASGRLNDTFVKKGGDSRGNAYTVTLDQPAQVLAGKTYYLILNLNGPGLKMASTVTVGLLNPDGKMIRQWLPDLVETIKKGTVFQNGFNSGSDGEVKEISLTHVVDWEARPEEKTLKLSIIDQSSGQILASGVIENQFLPGKDPRGDTYKVELDKTVKILKDQPYVVQMQLINGNGAIAVYGSRHALETSWDDPLPLGLDGFNPFDNTYGIYRSDLNFEMYWDDNQEKLQRFETILDQADYIYISSNRQWGTTVRVPERYPLTTAYYRNLIGCPENQDILWCYSVAEPGTFKGSLGFDLVKISQSDPNLGTIRFNSQFAEEAFTVYDHPKVLIFKKSSSFSANQMRSILESVDLSLVMHLTPSQASNTPGNTMLPSERLAQQRSGGTWSEIFNRQSPINQYPLLGLVFWYVVIMLLGWVCYPLVRFTFAGLPDRGFPLTRLVGLLLLAFLTWVTGSAGIPFNPFSITMVFLFLLIINSGLFWIQRKEILDDIRQHWKRYLTAELVVLSLFTIFLLIRVGNPDLWHPAKGGEKPMDFSYLNAVIKSTTFPPYDPWFSGGYINYYYFGFVLTGVPIKWLGIIPSIAYNLVLPTFFSFFGAAAFSIGWNIISAFKTGLIRSMVEDNVDEINGDDASPFTAGILAVILGLIVGNLGTVRMIWQGLMRLVTPDFENGNLLQKLQWTGQGFVKYIGDPHLPYGAGDWYWIPSRAIPGEPITEFPMFTFLYADPHAHLFALPFTLLALSWALSMLLLRWNWEGESRWMRWVQGITTFMMGGLVIGCLYPTNTWDMPVYLAIGCVVVLYTAWQHAFYSNDQQDSNSNGWLRFGIGIAASAGLVALSFLFYRPFSQWFVQGYNAIDIWKGDRTPIGDYLTHWGLFLFIIFSWMLGETIDWMDKTPLSRIRKLFPFWGLILLGLFSFVAIVFVLQVMGVEVAWLTLVLSLWALILILRPDQSDLKRFVLFLVGSALVLTLAVELVTLKGDIGRMNTVFKFYLQAWTLFAISAAAGLVWVYPVVMRHWLIGWRTTWTFVLALLLGGAGLFPILASTDKILDRFTSTAPRTLDGMAYMQYANYNQEGKTMDLSQDYHAIQWMQDNVKGSPVIVEANTPEYRWGTRFTIYTGLPGVVGWNWHQRQQRAAVNSSVVSDRVQAVNTFYNTLNIADAEAFINKYNVKYIVVGQLERIVYPDRGLVKFENYNGQLWDKVYQEGDTVIYQVR